MPSAANHRNWDLMGSLRNRYETPAPRKMLALDGGGIRGLLTLQVLLRMEDMLKARPGRGSEFRLCDYFDYIGGTSTGAIIAAALARGMSVLELIDFYRRFGGQVFEKRSLFERWKSLYGDGALGKQLQSTFGPDTTLHTSGVVPDGLKCLLLVVTRNATTDSAWPISSNPFAKWNDPGRSNCNLKIPLWRLVRASAAAPIYFPPEVIQCHPDDRKQDFVFVDGGTTPYNNPAFVMYRMATEPAYRLGWPNGERNLLIVSVGTGSAPHLGNQSDDPESNWVASGLNTLQALMSQVQDEQDLNCRTIGRCTFGSVLDREVGDLIPRDGNDQPIPLSTDLGRAFLYARYNVEMTERGLASLGIRDIDPATVSKLDSTEHMHDLERIGSLLAERVDLAHFGRFA